MVLSYFKEAEKPPLILDNLSFKVLNLNARKDLRADLFINSTGVYKLTQKNLLIKVAQHFPKYEHLLQKIKAEN